MTLDLSVRVMPVVGMRGYPKWFHDKSGARCAGGWGWVRLDRPESNKNLKAAQAGLSLDWGLYKAVQASRHAGIRSRMMPWSKSRATL